MYEVTINHKTGTKTYKVYTKEEADTNNITYKPWNEARQGDWGITDDNYVSECYSSKKTKTNYNLRFPVGTTWNNSKQFIAKGRENIYSTNGKSYMSNVVRTKKMKTIANYVARKIPVSTAIKEVIEPKTISESNKWLRMTKTKEFKRAVSKEKVEMLAKHGITDETLAEKWNELEKDAVELGNDNKLESIKLRRGILQDLSQYKGWARDDKVKLKQEQIEGVFDTKMLGEILKIKGTSQEAEGNITNES
ncbi:MAG: hypothetical protein CBB96_09425 [Gammaproteobacteria bacterium TMED36]|jgi:hypothetical protein|nr:MAG: hypothetical protein CBB96_09425 [Gammaproteobacteria bacterium TMED36]|tara:strand:- start:115 stop:864 length:750 start_codon:yes stop_codon:yes gene_type:complete